MPSCKCNWLDKLIAEQHDTSYRVKRVELTRDREQMFFDAGRYAAGARDKKAIDAHYTMKQNG